MAIPIEHAHRYLYHFTHIDNLPQILKHGFLANTHRRFPADDCRSIAEPSIQKRRSEMDVTCGPGGKVHDYVPLYFGTLSPMLLAVVNRKNVDQADIVYFEFPIALLERETVVFTDASANTAAPPNFFSDPVNLSNLNWQEIDSIKWGCASEQLRHQRMAEVLVFSKLSVAEATRVVVWNASIRTRLEAMVTQAGAQFPPITFESSARRHYFCKFGTGEPAGESLVTGPRGIRGAYDAACKAAAECKRPKQAPFDDLEALLAALRHDFGCIKQTAEIVGLQSANGMHKKTVDIHTKEVVAKLKASPEFRSFPILQQNLLELGAYLHDIGKGPKSRWIQSGGLQKVDPDHPIRALPMMVDILTTEVKCLDIQEACLLLKLVCYHDLIGEVIGKQRDEKQIVDIAGSEVEVDLLFALGKADATSLAEGWWNPTTAEALRIRCKRAIKARNPSGAPR